MRLIGLTDKKMLTMLYTNLVIFTVGMGLFPILPLYTAQLGLQRGAIGIFFGVIYLANATGAMSTGWLSARISRRQLFIAAGVIGAPAIALIGQTQAVWLVSLLSAIAWFTGGMLLSLINVYIGQHVEGNKRGKSFSLTMLAIPLGSLLGGTIVGQLVAWKGYELMFIVLGMLWISHILVGIFALKEDRGSEMGAKKDRTSEAPIPLGRSFYLLLALSLLTATAINASRLGAPLSMQALNYSPKDVASSATVSGLVTIPLTLLIGVLSDRLGRKGMLAATYLIAASGALMLSLSNDLWQFWAAASLMMVAFVSSSAMAAAMATDILEPSALARGLPWINAMTSLTGILTFAGTGYMMEMLGPQTLFMGMAVLPVAATALLETSMRKPAAEPEPCREAALVREGVWVNECM
jgi:MFS family permease